MLSGTTLNMHEMIPPDQVGVVVLRYYTWDNALDDRGPDLEEIELSTPLCLFLRCKISKWKIVYYFFDLLHLKPWLVSFFNCDEDILRTLYLMLSLLLRSESFFRLRIWKPAWRSLTNWLICTGRWLSPRVTEFTASRASSWLVGYRGITRFSYQFFNKTDQRM